MATIKVRVQGEIATNLTPEVRLVCQNDKYDVEFEFDESWANSNFKTALFIYNGKSIVVPFDREQNENVCKIPALYDTELLHIGVKSNDIDGLHTSTPARVGCLLSANDIANGEIPNPTPSQYDEIIALLNKYISGGGGSSGGGLTEEQVRKIVAEETAGLQTKTDENLETESKEVVGAINEVKGLTETARMVFGETEGTAYEGNKGKANADSIAKLQNEIAVVNVALEQSGLVKKYKQPITQEYTERVTADGANVLDGSTAILKKVVGRTVACKNYFNAEVATVGAETTGTAFISKVSQGSVTVKTISGYVGSGLAYTEKTLADFCPNIKVGQTVYFNANINGEPFQKALYLSGVGVYWVVGTSQTITQEMLNAIVAFVGLRSNVDASNVGEATYSNMRITENASEPYQPYFTGLKSASFAGIESTNADATETSTLIFPKTDTPLGVTIDFEKQVIIDGEGTEIPFTEEQKLAGNEYIVNKGGTEKIIGNDNAEYGADNTLTQDYILVTEV